MKASNKTIIIYKKFTENKIIFMNIKLIKNSPAKIVMKMQMKMI